MGPLYSQLPVTSSSIWMSMSLGTPGPSFLLAGPWTSSFLTECYMVSRGDWTPGSKGSPASASAYIHFSLRLRLQACTPISHPPEQCMTVTQCLRQHPSLNELLNERKAHCFSVFTSAKASKTTVHFGWWWLSTGVKLQLWHLD